LVNHGHFQVNGKKVDIASYQVRPGEIVSVKARSKDILPIQHSVDTLDRTVPEWMTVETDSRKITIDDLPSREQIDTDIQEQLIVELYSK
jgi:small subunit ribosomal protein S4